MKQRHHIQISCLTARWPHCAGYRRGIDKACSQHLRVSGLAGIGIKIANDQLWLMSCSQLCQNFLGLERLGYGVKFIEVSRDELEGLAVQGCVDQDVATIEC